MSNVISFEHIAATACHIYIAQSHYGSNVSYAVILPVTSLPLLAGGRCYGYDYLDDWMHNIFV